MKIILLSAAAAFLCFSGCKTSEHAVSAAESGLRKELKAVGIVLSFRELSTEEKEAPGGTAAVVRFESDVKWFTLEEALSSQGAAGDAQEYLVKLEEMSSKLGAGPKTGHSGSIKGAILLAKTDTGWIYKGLSAE